MSNLTLIPSQTYTGAAPTSVTHAPDASTSPTHSHAGIATDPGDMGEGKGRSRARYECQVNASSLLHTTRCAGKSSELQ